MIRRNPQITEQVVSKRREQPLTWFGDVLEKIEGDRSRIDKVVGVLA